MCRSENNVEYLWSSCLRQGFCSVLGKGCSLKSFWDLPISAPYLVELQMGAAICHFIWVLGNPNFDS